MRSSQGGRRKRNSYWWSILPIGVLYTMFFAVPIGSLVVLSFWQNVPGQAAIPDLQLGNYLKFLTDDYYLRLLWRTLVLGFSVSGVCLLLGYPLAYSITRADSRTQTVLTIAVITPLLTSAVIRSFGWMVLLSKGGPVTVLLESVGLKTAATGLMYTFTGMVLSLAHIYLPFMIFLLQGVLHRIPTNLEEAAGNLGASRFSSFLHVVLPLSLPGVVAGTLLVFTMTISAFVTPSLIGGPRLKVLATEIFDQTINLLNWPFASAMAVVLVLLILSISTVYNWMLERSTNVGEAT